MMQFKTEKNLVVCQKSKIDDWRNHFAEFYKYDISAYDLTKKQQWEDFWNNPVGYKYQVGIINYDLLFRRSDFLQLEQFTLMLDESSMVQNEKAKRSKFILKLKADNVILLSGTPTSGKYENLWSQIHMLGWDISNKLYNKQYVNWTKLDLGGFIQMVVDKDEPYKNVDRLKSKLRNHGAVFMKTEECFELPEQMMIPVKVPTSKAYRKFKRNSVLLYDSSKFKECKFDDENKIELVGDTTLTKRLYLRQLCGQYSKEKLEAFKDLVESTQDRLIVFYNYNAELDALKEIAAELERPVSEVNGHMKDLSAYENESNSITLIQYQAGAKGLNLQKANKIIYYTPTDKCEDWMQSQKRIHRIGQENTCYYYQLICIDSVEEDIYKALSMGVDYTDYLFEEGENERFK